MSVVGWILNAAKMIGIVFAFVLAAIVVIAVLGIPLWVGVGWLEGHITFEGLVAILLIMLVYLQIL